MEAIKLLEEAKRMCESHSVCEACLLFADGDSCAINAERKSSPQELKRIVESVQKWSSEHPKVTRLSNLLRIFPDLFLDNARFPSGCVRDYDQMHDCPIKKGALIGNTFDSCVVCKQQFWNQEITSKGDLI